MNRTLMGVAVWKRKLCAGTRPTPSPIPNVHESGETYSQATPLLPVTLQCLNFEMSLEYGNQV